MEQKVLKEFQYKSITKTLNNFREQGQMWKDLEEMMKSTKPSQSTFMILHSKSPIVVETCWPTEKGDDLKLSKEQKFASLTYVGPMEDIHKGYEEMEREMAAANLSKQGPSREVYHEMNDFSKVKVEILYPLA